MPASLRNRAEEPNVIQRIVVGVGADPQTRDAAVLAATIARATGAGLTLVAVRPRVVHPIGESDAKVKARLRAVQALLPPEASTTVESAPSVATGLSRVVARERADLVILGSSRRAPPGVVRIGKPTRQLLAHSDCPLAVAQRGLHSRRLAGLTVIGVGYDGSAGADAALRRAQMLARAAGGRLRVRAVMDDRLPYVGWSPTAGPGVYEIWDTVVEPGVESLRESAEHAVSAAGADAVVEADPGSPPVELIALSREVDLLVIGSGRWGAAARTFGTTGEELMHQAHCSVMVVPCPSSSPEVRSGAG